MFLTWLGPLADGYVKILAVFAWQATPINTAALPAHHHH